MRAKGKEDSERRWRRHLAAAQCSGQTLWRYAAERGLSSAALYAARRRLAANASGVAPSPFAAVEVVAPSTLATPSAAGGGACLRARLDNGAHLELVFDAGAAALLSAAIAVLAEKGTCSASTPA